MKYKIEQINQDQTNTLLKKLFDRCKIFEKVFQAERDRKERGESIWCLPPEERSYFLVSVNGNNVLLAGINEKYSIISSIAKITSEGQFKGIGYFCVKKLIEDVIIDKVKAKNKKCIDVNTWESAKGTNLFRRLMVDLPRGIIRIERTQFGFMLYVDD
jgi:hypothetical protein